MCKLISIYLLLLWTMFEGSDAFQMATSVSRIRQGHRGGMFPSTMLWEQLPEGAIRDREEPLIVMFERAVVLQRSGSYDEALEEYKIILKAATQCNLAPAQYAEVHVNMGALYLRLSDPEQAKYHFRGALSHRKIGKVYVNLAVLCLQELQSVRDKDLGKPILEKARQYCNDALLLDEEDAQTKASAMHLLADIEKMMSQI